MQSKNIINMSIKYKITLSCLLITVIYAVSVSSVVFTRCGLAHELLRQGFPKEDLRNWVCLIEEVSSRNTKCKEGPKKKGMYDWGLFQINERKFCDKNAPGKECNVTCDDLITDDITKAATCAKYIQENYGFTTWDKYNEKCIHYLPRLALCGIHY